MAGKTSVVSVLNDKFGMVVFGAIVRKPLSGAICCQFSLNAGMTQEQLNARLRILPIHETLRQGRKNVGDQFVYRYNCDERSVLAAVAQFHRGLWFTIFASSDERIIELFTKPEFSQLPASVVIKPGGLNALLSTAPCF
jgi:hypothetical protein